MLQQAIRLLRHTLPALRPQPALLSPVCAFSAEAAQAVNHYEVLGVARTATAADIKSAFRKVFVCVGGGGLRTMTDLSLSNDCNHQQPIIGLQLPVKLISSRGCLAWGLHAGDAAGIQGGGQTLKHLQSQSQLQLW